VNRRPFAELDQVFVDACGKMNRTATTKS